MLPHLYDCGLIIHESVILFSRVLGSYIGLECFLALQFFISLADKLSLVAQLDKLLEIAGPKLDNFEHLKPVMVVFSWVLQAKTSGWRFLDLPIRCFPLFPRALALSLLPVDALASDINRPELLLNLDHVVELISGGQFFVLGQRDFILIGQPA